ncbi:Hypothetical predicted protein [Podarcis lilfordi]|uniref:Uncharacterized protein n=1 Tax=Podarcis lilfordi TaxID=74358 RepID=A0AA35L798_9SAUR|nr:Hypothetical predicted protein [Podarcis lilfordi]
MSVALQCLPSLLESLCSKTEPPFCRAKGAPDREPASELLRRRSVVQKAVSVAAVSLLPSKAGIMLLLQRAVLRRLHNLSKLGWRPKRGLVLCCCCHYCQTVSASLPNGISKTVYEAT